MPRYEKVHFNIMIEGLFFQTMNLLLHSPALSSAARGFHHRNGLEGRKHMNVKNPNERNVK